MRKLLRKKEIRKLEGLIKEEILKKVKLEEFKDNEGDFIFSNGIPLLFKFNNSWVLTLHSFIKEFNEVQYKKIIVDAGAIKFIVNGADIMRPGITKINLEIEKGEILIIKEETHNKSLALGVALFSGQEMGSMDSGKVIKSLHYVGDFIWNKKL